MNSARSRLGFVVFVVGACMVIVGLSLTIHRVLKVGPSPRPEFIGTWIEIRERHAQQRSASYLTGVPYGPPKDPHMADLWHAEKQILESGNLPFDYDAKWTAASFNHKWASSIASGWKHPGNWNDYWFNIGIWLSAIGIFLWRFYAATLGRLITWIRFGKAG